MARQPVLELVGSRVIEETFARPWGGEVAWTLGGRCSGLGLQDYAWGQAPAA